MAQTPMESLKKPSISSLCCFLNWDFHSNWLDVPGASPKIPLVPGCKTGNHVVDLILSLFCWWIYAYVTYRLMFNAIHRSHTWSPYHIWDIKGPVHGRETGCEAFINNLIQGISRVRFWRGAMCFCSARRQYWAVCGDWEWCAEKRREKGGKEG